MPPSGQVKIPSRLKNAKVIFEKDLCAIAEVVISKIPKEFLREEYFRKERKTTLFLITEQGKVALKSTQERHVTYTCALLSSAWHLSRANLVTNPGFQEGAIKLISILPKKFQEVEHKVQNILNIIYPNFPLELRFF